MTTLNVRKEQSTHYLASGNKSYQFKVSGGIVAIRGYSHATNQDFDRKQLNRADARKFWMELLSKGYVKHI